MRAFGLRPPRIRGVVNGETEIDLYRVPHLLFVYDLIEKIEKPAIIRLKKRLPEHISDDVEIGRPTSMNPLSP